MELSARPLFDNPGDAALFVARDEAARVEANCRGGVNTLLLGERGLGKTSLLNYVAFRLREDERPCVVIDAAPADDALGVIRLIATELGRRLPTIAARLGRAIDPHNPAALGEAGELVNAVRVLQPEQDGDPQRTAILLDSPPAGAAVHTLFGRLRDELWQLPYTWVVAAAASERGRLLTPPADVFFEDVVELAPLSPEQQEELIQKRLDPGQSTPWRLGQPGEENPRVLLQATREAVSSGVSADAYISAHAERHRKVERLGRAASMAYAELQGSGPASASDEELLNRLGWSRQRAAQVLAGLEGAGLVRAEVRPGPNGRPRKTFEIVPVNSR